MSQITISAYYEEDHDRLDALFLDFQRLKRQDVGAARSSFVAFRSGLLTHIAWEEEILFPLFESKTGMSHSGPTFVMRAEHQQIKSLLEAIHKKVAEGNPDSDGDESMLLSVLGMHNTKEENILYPAIDRSVSDEDRGAVFRKMREMPADATPCCAG